MKLLALGITTSLIIGCTSDEDTGGDSGESTATIPSQPNPNQQGQSSTTSLQATIDSHRTIGKSIVIDGNADDWAGIWEMTSTRHKASSGTYDIVATSIAPMADALYVMLRTKSTPSTSNYVYRFRVDFTGVRLWDYMITGNLSSGSTYIWTKLGNEDSVRTETDAVSFAVGEVVEFKVDYSLLADDLPESLGSVLGNTTARTWLRVYPLTYANDTVQDWGPAVASYILMDSTYSLDEPLPNAVHESLAMALPLKGRWMVSQGAYGIFSHHDGWNYDLKISDDTGEFSNPRSGSTNDAYYAFGQSIIAPLAGSITRAIDGNDDVTPLEGRDTSKEANSVVIAPQSNSHGVFLLHCQESSVLVADGDSVALGQELAKVGNSGATNTPHLHMHARIDGDGDKVPIAVTNAYVGLNPREDDPWRRLMQRWPLREGYYLENQ